MTPFKVVYGHDPPTLICYQMTTMDPPNLQEMLQLWDTILVQLKANLNRVQQFMKKHAYQNRLPLEFQIGGMVSMKLQPYRQYSVALRKNHKLGLHYFGPFLVLEKIGTVAYKLLLPPMEKIHPVFHISLLKHCKGNHTTSFVPLPLLSVEQALLQKLEFTTRHL